MQYGTERPKHHRPNPHREHNKRHRYIPCGVGKKQAYHKPNKNSHNGNKIKKDACFFSIQQTKRYQIGYSYNGAAERINQ